MSIPVNIPKASPPPAATLQKPLRQKSNLLYNEAYLSKELFLISKSPFFIFNYIKES